MVSSLSGTCGSVGLLDVGAVGFGGSGIVVLDEPVCIGFGFVGGTGSDGAAGFAGAAGSDVAAGLSVGTVGLAGTVGASGELMDAGLGGTFVGAGAEPVVLLGCAAGELVGAA